MKFVGLDVPADVLEHGMSVPYDSGRLRQFSSKLLARRSVTVAVLGGSNSQRGHWARWRVGWWQHVQAWMAAISADASSHSWVDASTPGSGSAWMELCLDHHVPRSVDLVLVEYAVNDPLAPVDSDATRIFERFLRRVLQLPSAPAVLLLNLFPWQNKVYVSNEDRFDMLCRWCNFHTAPLTHASSPMITCSAATHLSTTCHLNLPSPPPRSPVHPTLLQLSLTSASPCEYRLCEYRLLCEYFLLCNLPPVCLQTECRRSPFATPCSPVRAASRLDTK